MSFGRGAADGRGYLDRPRLRPRIACQAASSTTAPRIEPMMPLGRRANPSPLARLISRPPTNDPARPTTSSSAQLIGCVRAISRCAIHPANMPHTRMKSRITEHLLYEIVRSSADQVVYADRDGQDEGVVLAGGDRHPVAFADPEPAFGDVGDRDAVVGDLVLVIQDVALCFQRIAPGQLDGEPVAQRGDDRLLDRGDLVAAVLDGHGVAGPQQPLLQLHQLVAVPVLDEDGVAHPQDLGVDMEDPLALVVLDPEVVPDRQQLLAQQVAGTLVRRFATFLILPPPSPEHRPSRVLDCIRVALSPAFAGRSTGPSSGTP